jgi:hypothetical protein
MAKQIDILADWATSAASYGNYAIKPSTAKRLAGWTGGATPDVPPAPHINWLHKTAYENVGWLIDNVLFADTARWEQMPLTATGTFPTSAANMRFYFGNTLDSDFNEGAIAYDGASGFMAIGNAYNVGAIAGAAGARRRCRPPRGARGRPSPAPGSSTAGRRCRPRRSSRGCRRG